MATRTILNDGRIHGYEGANDIDHGNPPRFCRDLQVEAVWKKTCFAKLINRFIHISFVLASTLLFRDVHCFCIWHVENAESIACHLWKFWRVIYYHSDSGRVRISTPSDVIKTVCSNCAAKLPSKVTTVQSSAHSRQSCPPAVNIGSMVKIMPFCSGTLSLLRKC